MSEIVKPDERVKRARQRIAVEHSSFQDYGLESSVREREDRICWRGAAVPVTFKASDAAKEVAFALRRDTVIHLTPLSSATTLTRLDFDAGMGSDPLITARATARASTRLRETPRDERANVDFEGIVKAELDLLRIGSRGPGTLPMIVKEVLTVGPGIPKRSFIVEILATNGNYMGSAEIKNDLELKQVVGKEGADFFQGDALTWDLGKIFGFISKKRVNVTINTSEWGSGSNSSWTQSLHYLLSNAVITLSKDGRYKGPSELPKDTKAAQKKAKMLLDPNRIRTYTLRVLTKKQQVSGRNFNFFVLFEGTEERMVTHTDHYFRQLDGKDQIGRLHVTIRCIDRTDKVDKAKKDLKYPGKQLETLLPPQFPIDFTSKFKRSQFANYLIGSLGITYQKDGDYEIKLLTHRVFNAQPCKELPIAKAKGREVKKKKVNVLSDVLPGAGEADEGDTLAVSESLGASAHGSANTSAKDSEKTSGHNSGAHSGYTSASASRPTSE
jgi:hypothetical protein